MFSPLGLEYAGVLYHVTFRVDRQEPIYSDDQDREAWLAVLEKVYKQFNWLIHA